MASDNMTTALYVVVLVGWFCLMCIVLRCCQGGEANSLFELDQEIELSTFSQLHRKPLVCVDGQPARFARVQALEVSPPLPPSDSAAEEQKHGLDDTAALAQNETLPRLEVPSADPPLPSAEAVWSPILAFRTLVEPLTLRAAAFLHGFDVQVSQGEHVAATAAGAGPGPGPGAATVMGAESDTWLETAAAAEEGRLATECEPRAGAIQL